MLIGGDKCYMHKTVTETSLLRQLVEWDSVSWGEGLHVNMKQLPHRRKKFLTIISI